MKQFLTGVSMRSTNKLIYLLVGGVLVNLTIQYFVFLAFNPLFGGDSGGYTILAYLIEFDRIGAWDGGRPLLYPLLCYLINLIFGDGSYEVLPGYPVARVITVIQYIIFMISVFCSYKLLSNAIPRLCLWLFIWVVTFPPVAGIYANFILTESIAYSLDLIIVSYLILIAYERYSAPRYIYILSGLMSMAIVNRVNLLIPYGAIFSITLIFFAIYTNLLKRDLLRVVVRAVLLLAFLPICQCIFNYENTGKFTLTNIAGFSKSTIVYNIFDRVHEDDKVVGSILDGQYKKESMLGYVRPDTWTRAAEDLRAHVNEMPFAKTTPTGAGTYDLSAYIGRVSTYLIMENPVVVLDNFFKTFHYNFKLTMPTIKNDSQDPVTVKNLKNIKSSTLYGVYQISAKFYVALYSILMFIVLLILVHLIFNGGKFVLLLPFLSFLILNSFVVTLFGCFDYRYLYYNINYFAAILIIFASGITKPRLVHGVEMSSMHY